MSVDTKTMRASVEAAKGDLVAVPKADFLRLLDVVDDGQVATQKLVGIRDGLATLAAAA